MEWDKSTSREEIRFYLDGVNFHTVRANQVDATTWTNATNHGFFIILNVAMGGGFPDAFGGGPDAGTVPGHPLVVDYVQVLQSGGSGTTPPPTGNRDAYSAIQAESLRRPGRHDHRDHHRLRRRPEHRRARERRLGAVQGRQLRLHGGHAVRRPGRERRGARASAAWSRCAWTAVRTRPSAASPLGNTGGWQSWRTIPANISGVTGTHDVYLTFTSGQPADFVNVNWFNFGR